MLSPRSDANARDGNVLRNSSFLSLLLSFVLSVCVQCTHNKRATSTYLYLQHPCALLAFSIRNSLGSEAATLFIVRSVCWHSLRFCCDQTNDNEFIKCVFVYEKRKILSFAWSTLTSSFYVAAERYIFSQSTRWKMALHESAVSGSFFCCFISTIIVNNNKRNRIKDEKIVIWVLWVNSVSPIHYQIVKGNV